jgi:hypothetical protein
MTIATGFAAIHTFQTADMQKKKARIIEHDPEKWTPVSRLREAHGTVRRLA